MFAESTSVDTFKKNVEAELVAFKAAVAKNDKEAALRKLLNIVSQATTMSIHSSVDKTQESEKLTLTMKTWIETKGIPTILKMQ